jgi:hypothetical protein
MWMQVWLGGSAHWRGLVPQKHGLESWRGICVGGFLGGRKLHAKTGFVGPPECELGGGAWQRLDGVRPPFFLFPEEFVILA